MIKRVFSEVSKVYRYILKVIFDGVWNVEYTRKEAIDRSLKAITSKANLKESR